jgi:hypothetical protein
LTQHDPSFIRGIRILFAQQVGAGAHGAATTHGAGAGAQAFLGAQHEVAESIVIRTI